MIASTPQKYVLPIGITNDFTFCTLTFVIIIITVVDIVVTVDVFVAVGAMRPFTFCTLNLSSCTRKSINTHCYSHIICSNDNYILVTITNEWDSYGTVCEYIAVYQVINISIWVHGMCVMTQMRWMRQVWEWASRLAFVWYMHTSVQRIAAISKNSA